MNSVRLCYRIVCRRDFTSCKWYLLFYRYDSVAITWFINWLAFVMLFLNKSYYLDKPRFCSWNIAFTHSLTLYTLATCYIHLGGIVVARIFFGVHFFPQKVDDFLVVALNTHANTAKFTTLTLYPCPAKQKFFSKNWLFPPSWGALTTSPINYAKLFSRPGGPPAPTAPPGYAYSRGLFKGSLSRFTYEGVSI